MRRLGPRTGWLNQFLVIANFSRAGGPPALMQSSEVRLSNRALGAVAQRL